jgi:hypothetical protein
MFIWILQSSGSPDLSSSKAPVLFISGSIHVLSVKHKSLTFKNYGLLRNFKDVI